MCRPIRASRYARMRAPFRPDAFVSRLSAPAKAQLQIHFCVLLWGFTAILGKLISIAAMPMLCSRSISVC